MGIYVLSKSSNDEPAFVRARSVSRMMNLKASEDYYVVPACFEPNSLAKFALDVLCDTPFTLDPMERKLPTAFQLESKAATPPTSTRKPMSTPRATAGTTGTRQEAKRGNMSLAAARMSTVADEYAHLNN
jgi:hypothetical protein